MLERARASAVRSSMEAWGACVAGALDVKDYRRGLEEAGFTEIKVQPKGDASELVEAEALQGAIFSATITARK